MFRSKLVRVFAAATIGGALVYGVSGMDAAPVAQGPAQATEFHKMLTEDVGEWDAVVKFWMAPGTDPGEFTGTETVRMVGGFWSVAEFEGNFMGMPFEGIGMTGYDPGAKQFIGSWIDSMTPTMTQMKGSYDKATKELTMKYKEADMTGAMVDARSVRKYVDETTRVYTAYHTGEDGAEQKVMEITYAKKAVAADDESPK